MGFIKPVDAETKRKYFTLFATFSVVFIVLNILGSANLNDVIAGIIG